MREGLLIGCMCNRSFCLGIETYGAHPINLRKITLKCAPGNIGIRTVNTGHRRGRGYRTGHLDQRTKRTALILVERFVTRAVPLPHRHLKCLGHQCKIIKQVVKRCLRKTCGHLFYI